MSDCNVVVRKASAEGARCLLRVLKLVNMTSDELSELRDDTRCLLTPGGKFHGLFMAVFVTFEVFSLSLGGQRNDFYTLG